LVAFAHLGRFRSSSYEYQAIRPPITSFIGPTSQSHTRIHCRPTHPRTAVSDTTHPHSVTQMSMWATAHLLQSMTTARLRSTLVPIVRVEQRPTSVAVVATATVPLVVLLRSIYPRSRLRSDALARLLRRYENTNRASTWPLSVLFHAPPSQPCPTAVVLL
jgi:hypothetical protein